MKDVLMCTVILYGYMHCHVLLVDYVMIHVLCVMSSN